tara:strand:+ start:466 stop:957 length:492 start_codon:yes stop_codon:yes gene_type:complete
MIKTLNKLVALVLIIGISSCGVKKIGYNYELLCNGTGVSGVYLVKCYSYAKTYKAAKKKVKRDAMHGVLFKGVSANSVTGCTEQPPICNVSYEEKQEWFNNFFDSGDYLQYITLSNDGNVSASDRIKIKGGYKVGFTVAIKSDQLRKRMQKEGLARKMDIFDN